MKQITKTNNFNLTPNSLKEALELAKIISDSDLAPKDYKGKPGNTLIAIQMGLEVGLQPMQAIQNIAVINSRPSIWGDAAMALVLASPLCEDIIETLSPDGQVASCTAIRKGHEPRTYTFSREDAKRAGLLGKAGPWTNYEPRMLQMRARGFALRDKFADVLKGLILAEEAQDMPIEKDVTPKSNQLSLKEKLGIAPRQEETTQAVSIQSENKPEAVNVDNIKAEIENCFSLKGLEEIANKAKLIPDEKVKNEVRELFKKKKDDLKGDDSESVAKDYFGE